ncbi:MAG: RHS repeat protein, partial [Helicobacteraceae bacterium]|nr:RHS repeat protein [Helicobacteraceae bacterium]
MNLFKIIFLTFLAYTHLHATYTPTNIKSKIGNLSFTLTDFNLNIAGLPVQLNRTYSTLQASQTSDFGYGWSLEYKNVTLQENRVPGEEWRTTPDTLGIGHCFKFDKDHIVHINMPDGSSERFIFKFEKECGNYSLGSFYDAPKLYALNGSEAKLETLDASDTIAMNSAGEIIDANTLAPYNPTRYRLTLSNGMVYEIDQTSGLELVKDLRDNTLTYNDDGIISSKGESLTFTRDAQGRIVKVTDLSGRSMLYSYNEAGDLISATDPLNLTSEYSYDENHRILEYKDASGQSIATNTYDESGRLIRSVDANGNAVEFTHNLDGNEEIVKDKLGNITLYTYDDAGNILSLTNAEGETTSHTYDANGNTLTTTDPLGYTTTNTYDASGNILTTTDALGNAESTEYNPYGSPISISNKNSNTLNILYNAINTPKTITTATGATQTFSYDQFGNKIKTIDENNNTTTYVYDSNYIPFIGATESKGYLLKETQANGTTIEHTYDSRGNRLTTTTTTPEGTITTSSASYDAYDREISQTDERGNTTTYTYDARGNKVSQSDAEGRTTTYEYTPSNKLSKTTYPDNTTELKTYDAMDNLLSETNREGHTTTYTYDKAYRLIKTIYPDGTATTTTYDAAGRVTSTTDANANTTTYTYDALDNQTSITDPLGHTTTFTYDAAGNMLSQTNALEETTSYEYNTQGMPIAKTDAKNQTTNFAYKTDTTIPLLQSVTLPNSTTTEYDYNTLNQKTLQKDALGRETTFAYTNTGELKEEILPQGEKKTYTYDAFGKQTQLQDYANKTTKFIYDSNDRLVRIELTDGNTVTYSYTPSGQIKQVTDNSGTITYAYDARGRVTSITNQDNQSINYTYDNVGNITQIQSPTTTISKTYTKRNELESVTDATGTINYTYDALGRNTQINYSNGMQTTYEYNSKNQTIKIEHTNANGVILQSYTYTYDNNGNRVKIVEANSRTIEYTYDDTNKLLSESITNDPNGNNTQTTYNYDAVGNLVTKTVDATSTEFTYNKNDQLTQKANETLTYDANGNLIQQGNITYSYDAKNRLISVTTPTDTIEYQYDANNNRTVKIVNGETTTYLIDTNTQFAKVITESKSDGTTINYTYGNQLLNQTSQNETLYYLPDALGSIRELADQNQNITDHYLYSPYGELQTHDGDSENSFLYTGEQYDKETDNYYLRARYYSPENTRFLTRDTYDGRIAEPITLNHYAYANSNPTMYTDPSGNMSVVESTFAIATLGIIGSSATYAILQKNNSGAVGSAWAVVIDYDLSFLQRDILTFIMMAGVLPQDRTQEQAEEADRDYWDYKNYCDENKPKQRDYSDNCSFWTASSVHARTCIQKMENFDEKWGENRHDHKIQDWKTRL